MTVSKVEAEQMAKKVLVVDDEKLIVKGIRFSLEQDDMEVDYAYDGESALEAAHAKQYDVILLDVMLPKMSGFDVCQQIREFSDVPIIMLTAKGDDMDNYITKPFNILEVKARIKAIIRRSSKQSRDTGDKMETYGSMKVDAGSRRVYLKNREISLTTREYELLSLLIRNPRKIYSREQLLHEVWGASYPGDARTVDVHIRRLREKIEENPSDPVFIHTKWGVGYYFENKE